MLKIARGIWESCSFRERCGRVARPLAHFISASRNVTRVGSLCFGEVHGCEVWGLLSAISDPHVDFFDTGQL
jgi:hypothetical protein